MWMVSPAARVSRCDRARLPDAEGRLRARIRLARVSADPAIRFPGESDEYRLARNRLLEAEIELRRTIERLAAQRRALPRGGAVPEDYVFEEAAGGGGDVRFSELFAPDKDTLGLWHFDKIEQQRSDDENLVPAVRVDTPRRWSTGPQAIHLMWFHSSSANARSKPMARRCEHRGVKGGAIVRMVARGLTTWAPAARQCVRFPVRGRWRW